MDPTDTLLMLSWIAPPSLEVSTDSTIACYILGNNITNITKTIINPLGCRPAMPCNYSFGLSDPSLNNGCYGVKNATILDYNGAILFTFFAVNGAGNGNQTTFTYIRPGENKTC